MRVRYSNSSTEHCVPIGSPIPNYHQINYLDCSYTGRETIANLPQFLEELNCSDNHLTQMPEEYPKTLLRLDCSINKLTRLPNNLPNTIEIINCSRNNLVELPCHLPTNLRILKCTRNRIVSLPLEMGIALNRLTVIKCQNNDLTTIPDSLPETLEKLICYGNKITKLPSTLPKNLKDLDCCWNQLTTLPDFINTKLKKLECSHNKIKELPSNLTSSIKEIICDENYLTNLPDALPSSLRNLYANRNQLSVLPETLPDSLRVIEVNHNQITSLPSNLPESLEEFSCTGNKITQIPVSIVNCRALNVFGIQNNPIEYVPLVVHRFLNRLKTAHLSVYNDSQSVHNHNIQDSIRKSIYAVLQDKSTLSEDEIIQLITSDTVLTAKSKSALLEYADEKTPHSALHITFKDLLLSVWQRIHSHKDSMAIKEILNQEILDGLCLCFTGRLSRLVNCLNGFCEDVTIQIGSNEQIGNIVVMTKEKLMYNKQYTVEKHRSIVEKELFERGYQRDIIEEWLNFIDE